MVEILHCVQNDIMTTCVIHKIRLIGSFNNQCNP